ncbi:MAG: hypothetical protein OXH20_12235 [bacterium]|nr:hypothetical protein [bacterium]MXZ29944.1 hypothetical protein [Acidimicrobiia bacterium]MYB23548.1 hypothetical protein [Acidimicrobiia bacterium]MYJ13208.1 hypothetical protein [Acidimicrobiia bacterium]MYK90339.1 hypothetical protein [Acidobacteriota bacterium]
MSERHVWRFAEAGRRLAATAADLGVQAPSFRTPPRVAGVDRTIRRAGDGSVLVSVRSRGRAWAAVLADMIEGVVHANDLPPQEAARARNELWAATADIDAAAPPAESPELPLQANAEIPRAA